MADSHFTTSDVWSLDTVQTAIDEAVAHHAARAARSHHMLLRTLARSLPVESPIEAVFWIWWETLGAGEPAGEWPFDLVPQHDVEINGSRYRLDFAIPELRIAVELDGHDFHERTKEQVERRNKRDRDLQSAGWTVLHFSGTELLRDSWKAVLRVAQLAEQKQSERAQ